MNPWVLAALFAALLVAVAQRTPRPPVELITTSASQQAVTAGTATRGEPAAPCPAGSLPDEGVCVPVPATQSSPAPAPTPPAPAAP